MLNKIKSKQALLCLLYFVYCLWKVWAFMSIFHLLYRVLLTQWNKNNLAVIWEKGGKLKNNVCLSRTILYCSNPNPSTCNIWKMLPGRADEHEFPDGGGKSQQHRFSLSLHRFCTRDGVNKGRFWGVRSPEPLIRSAASEILSVCTPSTWVLVRAGTKYPKEVLFINKKL